MDFKWNEPDSEALDRLAHIGSMAADRAYFDHMNDISSVRGPDGEQQKLTNAEMTNVQVREAIRVLLANDLIQINDTDRDSIILDPPVIS